MWKKGSALVPSWTAFAVIRLLEEHFTHLVDYDFTARMEESLDDIARGERESVPWLRHFYFGNGVDRPADAGRAAGPRDRRPRDQHHPASGSTPTAARSSCGSAATGPTCPGGRRRRPSPTGSPPTS